MIIKILFSIYLYLVKPVLLVILKITGVVAKRSKEEFESYQVYKANQLKSYDYTIEVSSEGEFEQLIPFLDELLALNKTVLLFYCSRSVEKKVFLYRETYKDRFHCLLLPLTQFFWNPINFSKISNSKNLLMVRYDLFPEIIYFLDAFENKSIISASVINKGMFSRMFYRSCCKLFSLIVPVTTNDKKHLSLSKNIVLAEPQDARVLRIFNRLGLIDEKVKQQKIKPLFEFINQFNKKVIFGSCYINDFQNIEFKNNFHYFLCPHKLDNMTIALYKETFGAFVIDHATDFSKIKTENYNIWLINIKGILCELYSLFNVAYVGGGFNRSVHSLLEPFIAGCNVSCGPKIERSTEYLNILTYRPDKVQLVSADFDFNSYISTLLLNESVKEDLNYIESIIYDEKVKFNATLERIVHAN